MLFKLGENEGHSVNSLVGCLVKFFESGEGLGIRDIKEVNICLGARVYFNILQWISLRGMEKFGNVSIDGNLKVDEIEILRVGAKL